MERQTGFTLIELLVTLAAATILASIAVPNFKLSIQNGRLVSQANDVLAAVMYARSQAVTLNKSVTVCASADQATCSSSANAWNSGWIICQPDCSATTNILRVHGALDGGNTVTNTAGSASLVFKTDGSVANAPLSFDICDTRGAASGRSIYVYATGMAKVSTTAGQTLAGASLTC